MKSSRGDDHLLHVIISYGWVVSQRCYSCLFLSFFVFLRVLRDLVVGGDGRGGWRSP